MPYCRKHNCHYGIQCSNCCYDKAKKVKLKQKAESKRAQLIEKQKLKAQQPKARIKPVSDKMKVAKAEYLIVRKEHLTEFPECQIKLPGCEVIAVEIHHTASRGIHLTNKSTFKSTCRHCHDLVHTELTAQEARELGLKTSPINQERKTI